MAHVYDNVDAEMAAWIERQPLFFVATAPVDADGLVNVSPKGTTGTFRMVDDHTFAYLDITGSGVETIAHLQENGRICVMFCSFDRRPTIVRLHGTGRAILSGDAGFEHALAGFGEAAQCRRSYLRAVIVVDVARVSAARDPGPGVADPRRPAHRDLSRGEEHGEPGRAARPRARRPDLRGPPADPSPPGRPSV